MKLYSVGQRSYIVDPKKMVKGGTYRKEDFERKWMYVNPKDKFECEDAYGTRLMKMYPEQFMELDGEGKIPYEAKAKKTGKKVAKKAAKKGKRQLVMA